MFYEWFARRFTPHSVTNKTLMEFKKPYWPKLTFVTLYEGFQLKCHRYFKRNKFPWFQLMLQIFRLKYYLWGQKSCWTSLFTACNPMRGRTVLFSLASPSCFFLQTPLYYWSTFQLFCVSFMLYVYPICKSNNPHFLSSLVYTWSILENTERKWGELETDETPPYFIFDN